MKIQSKIRPKSLTKRLAERDLDQFDPGLIDDSLVSSLPLSPNVLDDPLGELTNPRCNRVSDIWTIQGGMGRKYKGEGENIFPQAGREDLEMWDEIWCHIDGTDGIVANADESSHYIAYDITSQVTGDQTLVVSMSCSPAFVQQITLGVNFGAGGYVYGHVDLVQGTKILNFGVLDYGMEPDELGYDYRVWIAATIPSNADIVQVLIGGADNDSVIFKGDGTTVSVRASKIQVESYASELIDTEAGYTIKGFSGADGQSWFDAEKLGGDLFIPGRGDFSDPAHPTGSWIPYGTNTIENDNETLKITYVDNPTGAYLEFKDSADLISDLTVGQFYKLTLDIKVNASSSVNIYIYDGGSGISYGAYTNIEFQSVTIYFIAQHATNVYINFKNMSASEIVWLDNIVLEPVTQSIGDYENSGYLVTARDDANRIARGYFGKRGTGITLGSEQVENGGFGDGTTGWRSGYSALLESVADGVEGNCLKITENGATDPHASQPVSITKYKQYKFAAWVKAGTEATLKVYGFAYVRELFKGEAPFDWSYNDMYLTIVSTVEQGPVLMVQAAAGSGLDAFFDEISFKEVLTPDMTACHVYQDPAMTQEGWFFIQDDFNPNAIQSFEVRDNKHTDFEPRDYSGATTDIIPAETPWVDEGLFNPGVATNLLLQNKALDQAPWSAGTLVESGYEDIFGSKKAFKLTDNDINNAQYIVQVLNKSSEDHNIYTLTYILLKDANSLGDPFLYLLFSGGSNANSYGISINLKTGIVTERGGNAGNRSFKVTSEKYWWKVKMSASDTADNTSIRCNLYPKYYPPDGDYDPTLTGSIITCYPQVFRLPYDPQVIIPTKDSPVAVTDQTVQWDMSETFKNVFRKQADGGTGQGRVECRWTPFYDYDIVLNGYHLILSCRGAARSLLFDQDNLGLIRAYDGITEANAQVYYQAFVQYLIQERHDELIHKLQVLEEHEGVLNPGTPQNYSGEFILNNYLSIGINNNYPFAIAQINTYNRYAKPDPETHITIGYNGYMSGYQKNDYGVWTYPFIGGHEVISHLSNYSTNVVQLNFIGGKLDGVDHVRVVMDDTYEVTMSWDATDSRYEVTDATYADRLQALRGQTAKFQFTLM